jgi:DNA-directed RNA polymerase specialized sigma24 family protein
MQGRNEIQNTDDTSAQNSKLQTRKRNEVDHLNNDDNEDDDDDELYSGSRAWLRETERDEVKEMSQRLPIIHVAFYL